MGVNHHRFDPARHVVVSNASCTTNCPAAMAFVLHERFGIVDGFMSTVHAYTNDQNLLDLPHRGHTRDFRRARAAAQNIVPSTTGAARAIGLVRPELAGRLEGMAFRVPVACGSVTDLVCTLERTVTRDEVNDAFIAAAAHPRFRGIVDVTHLPLVSADIVGRPQSCVFSACDTMVNGTRVKVIGWYDNEWGYANRLLELAAFIGNTADRIPIAATRWEGADQSGLVGTSARLGPHPWALTFSYGRALQDDALRTWAGSTACVAAARAVLLDRVRANGAAALGRDELAADCV